MAGDSVNRKWLSVSELQSCTKSTPGSGALLIGWNGAISTSLYIQKGGREVMDGARFASLQSLSPLKETYQELGCFFQKNMKLWWTFLAVLYFILQLCQLLFFKLLKENVILICHISSSRFSELLTTWMTAMSLISFVIHAHLQRCISKQNDVPLTSTKEHLNITSNDFGRSEAGESFQRQPCNVSAGRS